MDLGAAGPPGSCAPAAAEEECVITVRSSAVGLHVVEVLVDGAQVGGRAGDRERGREKVQE